MEAEWVDVVVVGAGFSGISAGHHLRTMCPNLSFAMLERRSSVGGTWDLFSYPGVRSDSDMYTFGFHWKPWRGDKVISSGKAILEYLNEAVDEDGLRDKIRFNSDVASAAWSSAEQRWSLELADGHRIDCRFLFLTTGYYSYETPHKPDIPGLKGFKGRVVHPQEWTPADTVACKGKRVVVIGSGATAATLVPALAKTALHVTQLQRSPGYYISLPDRGMLPNRVVHAVAGLFSASLAHTVSRWQYTFEHWLLYRFCKSFPGTSKRILMARVSAQMPADFETAVHFNPSYNPWDQRVCLVPDGDFFKAVRDGDAEMVTGTIDSVTEGGIKVKLCSSPGGEAGEVQTRTLPADVIVTATGLTMQDNFPMSTIAVTVDGEPYDAPKAMIYKACMLSGVPNLAFTIGYSNASWTLRADMVSERVCRILNRMTETRSKKVVPNAEGVVALDGNVLGLTSGYLARAEDRMCKSGEFYPWDASQNTLLDKLRSATEVVDDGILEFDRGVDDSSLGAPSPHSSL